MRYPIHQPVSASGRWLIAFLAVGLLVISLYLVTTTWQPASADADFNFYSPSPRASLVAQVAGEMSTLQLFDSRSLAPLAGQSVAVIPQQECPVSQICPEPSPLIVVADQVGRIKLTNIVIHQRPKLYLPGYKMDTYFSFLNPDDANELTLYQPLPGTKLNYQAGKEDIPVGLVPTH